MTITETDVKKIARLARLALTADEVDLYQSQLSAILTYAEMLNNLQLDDIPATIHAISRENIMRNDIVEPSLSSEDVFYNANEHSEGQFSVLSVLDEGG